MNRRFLLITAVIAVILISCGQGKKERGSGAVSPAVTIIDKGFSKYISAYTSGIVPVNGTLAKCMAPPAVASMNPHAELTNAIPIIFFIAGAP